MEKNDVLDEIASTFEYDDWSVTADGDGALVLERGGQAYRVRVEVRDDAPGRS